ncbi:MAG: hypothetical protein R3Y08_04815 [Rikenellaceae bacterium]
MKKLLLPLLTLLLVVGCKKENTTGNEGNSADDQIVTLAIEDIDSDDIKIQATPSEGIERYIVYPLTEDQFNIDFLGDESFAVNGILDIVDIDASDSEVTLFDKVATVSMSAIREIENGINYTIFAFGIDATNKLYGEVNYIDATLAEKKSPTGLGEITVSDVTYNDARVRVDANGWEGNYYVAPISKMVIDSLLDGDKVAFMELMLTEELENYGTDFSVVDNMYIFNGDADFSLHEDTKWLVVANTEYYMAAVGVDDQGARTTDVISTPLFCTAETPEVSFEISAENVTEGSVDVTYTPSIPGVDYFFSIVEWEVVKDKTDEQIITNFINYHGEYIEEFVTNDTLATQISSLKSGTDYMLVAFSYDKYNGSTGELYNTRFVTTGEPSLVLQVPTEVTIPDVDFGEINVFGIGGNFCMFSVDRNDKSMRYFPMVVTAESFNAIATDEERIINDLKYFNDYAFTVMYSFADILNEVSYSGDTQYSSFSDLEPLTDYVMYAFGIDILTAQPASKIVKLEFTTGEEDEEEEEYYTSQSSHKVTPTQEVKFSTTTTKATNYKSILFN